MTASVQLGAREPIHVRVTEWARVAPDRPALAFGGERLTYEALDRRADRIAAHLHAAGLAWGEVVGVFLPRTPDLIAVLLGVLKAGAGYLPLDTAQPPGRLAEMIADSTCSMLVTNRELAARLPTVPRTFAVDGELTVAPPAPAPAVPVHPDDLAYVIHTSGSTGRPKGIGIPHGAVSELLVRANHAAFGPNDRIAQVASLGFDASVLEIWGALLNGACLVGVPDDVRLRPPDLAALLATERVTVLHLTTSLFDQYVHQAPTPARPLRALLFGGERADPGSVRLALERGLAERLVHCYGPTECTVLATFLDVTAVAADATSIPIGRPITGARLYVLGRYGEPVPVGVRGEIHIGGSRLARGYWRRPAATAEQFVPDPFAEPGQRMYRTGDLGRWRRDGTLEFLGRADGQVKIRGVRVESGDVRAALLRHPMIRQAEVLVLGGTEPRLTACYVAPPEVVAADVRRFLADVLPPAFVPARCVRLTHLPLTPSGKVDRAALAALAAESGATNRVELPPAGVEREMADIWRAVLGVEAVGRDDNFFADLGGDSLLAMTAAARATESGMAVTGAQILRHQTVRGLAAHLCVPVAMGAPPLAERLDEPVRGPSALLPVQHWFLGLTLSDPDRYAVTAVLDARERLDTMRLRAALQAVVERHDALRLTFQRSDEGWVARCGERRAELDVVEVAGDGEPEAVADHAQLALLSLDMRQGPLWRLLVVDRGAGVSQRLVLVAHHLVSDAVSIGLFTADLASAYRRLAGRPSAPAGPVTSYTAWAERLRRLAGAGVFRPELDHWTAVLSHGMRLPYDRPDAAPDRASERWTMLEFPVATPPTGVYHMLLAALAGALCDWTGDHRILLDVEHHGRVAAPGLPAPVDSLGWYTTISPVALAVTDGPAPRRLGDVAAALSARPHHGLGYGALRYLDPDPAVAAALSGCAEPRVRLNYRGRSAGTARPDDLLAPADVAVLAHVAAKGIRSHDIEVFAESTSDSLRVGVQYAATQFDERTIAALLGRVRAHLGVLGSGTGGAADG